MPISAEPLAPKQRTQIRGRSMAWVEVGRGDPIVFLHGNPTSSYLWRNVMPHLADQGRCIAPDLIGMGDSDKLPDGGPERYRFVEHREYLDAFLEALGVRERVTLVIHDWGSALGFDWARRHADAVVGIAYMEAIVREVTWAEWPEAARGVFQAFRSPAGESMVLEKNVFIEAVLPGSILRRLDEREMAEYRRPFTEPGEGRRPMLTWPRQIPIEGEPADVCAIVRDYGRWLETSPVPKLFVDADPGAILIGDQREYIRSWPNQQEVRIKGSHFVQEDSPDEIGQAIARWRGGSAEGLAPARHSTNAPLADASGNRGASGHAAGGGVFGAPVKRSTVSWRSVAGGLPVALAGASRHHSAPSPRASRTPMRPCDSSSSV
jgi:haloalkane dehalogenase